MWPFFGVLKMNNLYLDEMIKQATKRSQRIEPTLYGPAPQPTPTAAPQPTPTAAPQPTPTAGAVPNQPKLHPKVQAVLDQAKLLGAELNKSPYTQAAVHMAKTTGKQTFDHVKDRVGSTARKVAGKVEDRVAEELANHLNGGKSLQEAINSKIDGLIDKVPVVANKKAAQEVAQDVAKSGVPMPLKVAGGLLAGGLGSYGAYKGYVGMNKEAAMSGLLEQGYSVENALNLVSRNDIYLEKIAASPISVVKSMASSIRNNLQEPKNIAEMYGVGALSIAGAPITHNAAMVRARGGIGKYSHGSTEFDADKYATTWAPAAFTVGTTAIAGLAAKAAYNAAKKRAAANAAAKVLEGTATKQEKESLVKNTSSLKEKAMAMLGVGGGTASAVLNKSAAMSGLLEQGYDLDSALYIIKKAEENQADAQYRASLDNAARSGLGKEAAVVYALEQGYSLEQALYMLR